MPTEQKHTIYSPFRMPIKLIENCMVNILKNKMKSFLALKDL